MKSQVLLPLVLSFAINVFGQGVVQFSNIGGYPVTNVHTGVRLPAGGTFKAALYFAPDGITDDSQYVVVGAPANFITPGFFFGGNRTVQGIDPNASVMLQVRVWEISYGNSYEAAEVASPANGRTALMGKSNRMRGQLKDPLNALQPPVRLLDLGLEAFGVASHPVPTLSINDVVVSEGTNGTKDAVFTVSLQPTATVDVSVDFATADGTALAGSDYVATNGTLVFAAGESIKTITVTLTPDVPPEPDETFFVNLSNAGDVPFVKSLAVCVITEVRVTGISLDVAVSFNTVANRSYVVERSDDMVNWSGVAGAENVPGTGGIVSVYDRGGGSQAMRMYRARLIE